MNFQTIINKRVKDGSLPKGFEGGLPTESIQKQEGYQLVYIPKGLTLDQWDTLLKKTCKGLWYSDNYNEALFGSKLHWETEYISAVSKPSETNITYTGAEKKYGKLLSVESYLALQWNRLELGQEPVDSESWSWLQQEDNLGLDSLRAPYGCWLPDAGQVRLRWYDVSDRDGLLGVRLPVWGDLNLPPSSESFASAELQKLLQAEYSHGWNDAIDMVIEQMPEKKL